MDPLRARTGKKDPSAELSVTYRVTLWGGAVFFVALIIELISVHYATYARQEVHALGAELQGRAMGLERMLDTCSSYVDSLRETTERSLGSELEPPGNPELQAAVTATVEGDYYTLGPLPSLPGDCYGSLVGVGSLESLSPERRRELAAALALFADQRLAHAVKPDLACSFYVSKSGFCTIYPRLTHDDLRRIGGDSPAQPPEVLDAFRGVASWEAEADPPAEGKWLGPMPGPLGEGLVVARVCPVRRGEEIVGLLATCLRPQGLQRWTVPGVNKQAQYMVVAEATRLVAHSTEDVAGGDTPALLADVLPAELRDSTELLLEADSETGERIEDWHVLAQDLKSVPWTVAAIVSRKSLFTKFLPNSKVHIIFVVGLALYLVLLHVLMRSHFVRPSLALVDHIRAEALAGPTPIPRVPAAWEQWFREISDTLPLKAVAATIPGAVFQFVRRLDGGGDLAFISEGAKDLVAVPAESVASYVGRELDFVLEEDREALLQAVEGSAQALSPLEHECRLVPLEGDRKWIRIIARPRKGDGGEIIWDGIALDVTVRREAEEERERLIDELQEALGQIKTLEGLLPICASCKRVRDDTGYWNQIESYIRERSDAEFTHSICPECATKLYPEYTEDTEE